MASETALRELQGEPATSAGLESGAGGRISPRGAAPSAPRPTAATRGCGDRLDRRHDGSDERAEADFPGDGASPRHRAGVAAAAGLQERAHRGVRHAEAVPSSTSRCGCDADRARALRRGSLQDVLIAPSSGSQSANQDARAGGRPVLAPRQVAELLQVRPRSPCWSSSARTTRPTASRGARLTYQTGGAIRIASCSRARSGGADFVSYRIGFDVGGTFTDFVLQSPGQLHARSYTVEPASSSPGGRLQHEVRERAAHVEADPYDTKSAPPLARASTTRYG